MMKQEIQVENVKCDGCVKSIQSALMETPGVEKVEVDKQTGIVTIEGNVDRELLTAELSKAGYPEKDESILKKAQYFMRGFRAKKK